MNKTNRKDILGQLKELWKIRDNMEEVVASCLNLDARLLKRLNKIEAGMSDDKESASYWKNKFIKEFNNITHSQKEREDKTGLTAVREWVNKKLKEESTNLINSGSSIEQLINELSEAKNKEHGYIPSTSWKYCNDQLNEIWDIEELENKNKETEYITPQWERIDELLAQIKKTFRDGTMNLKQAEERKVFISNDKIGIDTKEKIVYLETELTTKELKKEVKELFPESYKEILAKYKIKEAQHALIDWSPFMETLDCNGVSFPCLFSTYHNVVTYPLC